KPLNPPTFPGYAPSSVWGNTQQAANCRGMFCRGCIYNPNNPNECIKTSAGDGGPRIRLSDVTDGTTNTLMIGETLIAQSDSQRFGNSWGWAGYNSVSQGQTIQPINWPIDPNASPKWLGNCDVTCPGVDPAHCLWNWHVTWGFKSNHPGGVNFCFVDGSV